MHSIHKLVVLIQFIYSTMAGHIYAGPFNVTYPISQMATQYCMYFMLSTNLSPGEYIQLQFPYQLHGKYAKNSDVEAQLYQPIVYTPYSSIISNEEIYDESQDEIQINIQQQPQPSSNKYIPLLYENANLNFDLISSAQTSTTQQNIYNFDFKTKLQKLTWYLLIIQTNQTYGQTAKYQKPFSMLTLSSLGTNAIIYDENPSFCDFSLIQIPSSTMIVDVIQMNNFTNPGSSSNLIINFKPNQNITAADEQIGVNFLILVNSNDYRFVSNGSNCGGNLTLDCLCYTQAQMNSLKANQLKILCKQNLIINDSQSYQITATLQSNNYSGYQTRVRIYIYSIYPQNQQIIESGISSYLSSYIQIGNNVSSRILIGNLNQSIAITNCSITDWDPVLIKNTQRQAVQFNITPAININLTSGQKFTIFLQMAQTPIGISYINYCSVQSNYFNDEALKCAIGGSLIMNYISFEIGNLGADEYIIQQFQSLRVSFFISHQGSVTQSQQFTAQILIDGVLMDQCSNKGQAIFNSLLQPLSTSMNASLQFEVPNRNSRSQIVFEFNLHNRSLELFTSFVVNLGFIYPSNSLILNSHNERCQIFEFMSEQSKEKLSKRFSTIDFYQINQTFGIKFKSDELLQPESSLLRYKMVCNGMMSPDGTSTDLYSLTWIDDITNNQIIQSSQNIQLSDIPFIQSNLFPIQQNQPTIRILHKQLNSAGCDAWYTFQFTPTKVNMTANSRIYIEWSSAISPNLNSQARTIYCQINKIQIDCRIISARRLIIIPQSNPNIRLLPLIQYELIIGGLTQPTVMDQYAKIWFALDLDESVTNGVDQQGLIPEVPVQSSITSVLSGCSISFTNYFTRQMSVQMSILFTAPAQMLNLNKLLVIQMSNGFSVPLLSQGSTSLQCTLHRRDDQSNQNFAQNCTLVYDRLIVVGLLFDMNNQLFPVNYELLIKGLTTPQYQQSNPFGKNFPETFQILVTDATMSNVLYKATSTSQFIPKPLLFIQTPNQRQFYWYVYNTTSQIYKRLESPLGIDQYPVYWARSNAFNLQTLLYLGTDDPFQPFDHQCLIKISNPSIQSKVIIYGKSAFIKRGYSFSSQNIPYPNFSGLPSTSSQYAQLGYQNLLPQTSNMIIDFGDSGYWFSIASSDEILSSDLLIEFSLTILQPRQNSTQMINHKQLNQYSAIPILRIKLLPSNPQQCNIQVYTLSTIIPQGGSYSFPIVFKFSCQSSSTAVINFQISNPYVQASPNNYYFGSQLDQLVLNLNTETNTPSPEVQLFVPKIISSETRFYVNLTTKSNSMISPNSIQFQVISVQKQNLQANINLIQQNAIYKAKMSCNGQAQLIWSVQEVENAFNFTVNIIQDFQISTQNVISVDVTSTLQIQAIEQNYLNDFRKYFGSYANAGGSYPQNVQSDTARQILYGKIQNNWDRRISRRHMVKNKESVSLSLTNLQSGIEYEISSVCVDQWNNKSQMSSAIIPKGTVKQNPKHVLIKLTFSMQLSNNQINNILCSFIELLGVGQHQFLSNMCNQCDRQSLNYAMNGWSQTLQQNQTVDQILKGSRQTSSDDKNVYLYLLAYPYSNGNAFNPVLVLQNSIKSIINVNLFIQLNLLQKDDTISVWEQIRQYGLKVTNLTDDPTISYTYTNMSYITFTDPPLTKAQIKNSVSFTLNTSQSNISLTMQQTFSDENILVFVTQYIGYLTYPSPLQLRQGISGDGKPLVVETYLLNYNINQTHQFQTINNSLVIYTAVSQMTHCLSSSYLDIFVQQINIEVKVQTFSIILGINIIFTIIIMMI